MILPRTGSLADATKRPRPFSERKIFTVHAAGPDAQLDGSRNGLISRRRRCAGVIMRRKVCHSKSAPLRRGFPLN